MASLPTAAPRSLRRCLGTGGVLLLTLSVATPASSVFVIAPGMLAAAGTGAIPALALAGLVCVATAFVYAELGAMWPHAGGEYVFVARTLGPGAGFVMLGVNVFNNLLFPPVAALGVAAVAQAWVPGLPAVPVAIGVLSLATLLAVLDIRVNAVVTGGFLALEVVTLGAVSALGLWHPVRALGTMLLHPAMPASHGLTAVTPAAIGVATAIAIFALNGYGVAIYFSEEMHNAPHRIARAILLTLAATLALETMPIVAGLAGAPDLRAFLAADDPFGMLATTLGGAAAGRWIAAGVIVAIVNAVIAATLATARFFYASARDRCWGRSIDRWLAAIDPRLGSPVAATLMTGVVGIVACLLPLRFLLVVSGTGLIAIYAGITLAAVAGRRSGTTAEAPYRMPLYPLAPIVAGLALGYVTWLSWLDPVDGRPGVIATLAQIALAAAYYRLVLKRRGWAVTS